jgi:pyruvate formate-lyase/glycerol dehydratase family glycyl radical enzyme
MTQLAQETKTIKITQGVFIEEDTTNVLRAENAEAGTSRAYEEHARQQRRATPFGASEQNWRRRDKYFEYQQTYAIDTTRARCMTEVFQATEGQPQAIRIARGVARTLAEIAVSIDDDDLFAGNVTGLPMGSHIYPELMPDYYTAEMVDWNELRRGPWPVHITAEDLALLTSIAPYWRGKTVGDRWNELRRADDEALNRHCVYFSYNMLAGIGHVIANIPLVLRRGFAGLRQEATRARREEAAAHKPDPDRLAFYDSVIISLDGVVHYARRHAEVCARLAAAAGDTVRRSQLERMAEACRRVPEHPPRDTFEALQSALLVLYALAAESSQISICPGRVDQWLAPFVEQDLATGTPPEAIVELLEAVICKLGHWRIFTGREAAILGTGNDLCTFTIGGSHADGSDATTVVTEMVLRAYNHMRMAHPPLAMRVHKGTPDHVWEAAILCISNGCGMPSFMNDEVMVPALQDLGFSTEDAHNYADVGCVEMGSAGTSLGPVSIGFINLAKCLELALNDGRCAFSKDQLGPHTGTLAEHESFESVRDAYERQLAFAVENFNHSVSVLEQAHTELRPVPLLSALTDNALREGRDLIQGSSKYRYAGIEGIGFAEVADSLTAIKHLVFDEQAVTAEGLYHQIQADFPDERLRQRLINRAPKYGNDDDAADAMAAWVCERFVQEVKSHRDYWNSEYAAGAWSIALAMTLGFGVAALPNGRRASQTLTEGIRPASGCDRNGPTSCLKSVAKINHRRFQNGSIFNMTFTPDMLDGDANRRKFRQLLRTFFGMGGFQLQFNVVDAEVLREARAHPERHRGLIVRVAGYCAYFVDEMPHVQDQIIERTCNSAWTGAH